MALVDITPLFKGLLIGFSIAAPVGPIGILCIQRTLAYGRLSGFLTGLGAATADGIYGAVAAFGLTVISSFLTGQQFWLQLIGGLFLFYLGAKNFQAAPATQAATKAHKGLLYDYLSTTFLTLTNPATILSFIAIFAALGLGSSAKGIISALLMTAGVLTGSALWWFFLSGGVSLLRAKVTPSVLGFINKISGLILIGFSIFAIGTILPSHQ